MFPQVILPCKSIGGMETSGPPVGRPILAPISWGVSLVLTSQAGLIGLQLTQRGRHAVTESFELKWPRPARL